MGETDSLNEVLKQVHKEMADKKVDEAIRVYLNCQDEAVKKIIIKKLRMEDIHTKGAKEIRRYFYFLEHKLFLDDAIYFMRVES